MYVPRFNALDHLDAIRAMVRAIGSAELVTMGEDGYPLATRLPVIWDGDRLVLHIARANPHWRSIPAEGDVGALAIVTDAEAYVSPAWYAVEGRARPWLLPTLELLGGPLHRPGPAPRGPGVAPARSHAADRAARVGPRGVVGGDRRAPDVHRQALRAIAGLEVTIERVEGKAKLSQNRSEEDQAGVVAGLRAEGSGREATVADQMERLR